MSAKKYHPMREDPINLPEFANDLLAGPHGGIRRELRDGEPCHHAGCLSHQSHPCEGCGRIGGRSPILDFTPALVQDLHTALKLEDAGKVVPLAVLARINNATPFQLARALKIGQQPISAFSVDYRKGMEAGLKHGQAGRDELMRALKRVAFEPQGHAEASAEFVLDAVVQIARDAIEAAEKGGGN